jgi:hypothetical protein
MNIQIVTNVAQILKMPIFERGGKSVGLKMGGIRTD